MPDLSSLDDDVSPDIVDQTTAPMPLRSVPVQAGRAPEKNDATEIAFGDAPSCHERMGGVRPAPRGMVRGANGGVWRKK
jgi:hypothetical protein